MQLVISEKPSVAMSFAKVLGANSRKGGYMEGGGWLVSWCVGHLVELASADAYDARYSKWAYADLPIVPREWQYMVLPGTKKQFDVLAALMADERVDGIVCATDAGREGELIFRLVYDRCGCQKPVKRLWISSMEDSAIRRGFDTLADCADYDNLYAAALCRAKADWLVGINATRLFTLLYRKSDSNKTLNVGRVVTPTLALLAEREAAINSFKKEKFYTVELDFGNLRAVSARFSSKTDAENARAACMGKPVTVKSVSSQDKTERPPKLYDLTTLQREANRLFDYTAQQTLDYVQMLYEKKLATYPRTDSRYLTEDMESSLPDLCNTVAAATGFVQWMPVAVNAGLVVNSAKVSDHHAIIPTPEIGAADLASLPTGERNVLYMIAARLLCATGEPYQYTDTAVTLECGGVLFSASGRTERSEGWKAVERVFYEMVKRKKEQSAPTIPTLTEGQVIGTADAAIKEGVTRPPAHFTDDTLLSAMENASAEDFAKIEDVERAGLGTPATRAGIIEKLVKSGLAERNKKQLVPTEKGMELIRVLPDALKSAKLTAEWEEQLSEVQRGALTPADFLSGIVDMLNSLVKSYEDKAATASAPAASGRPIVGKCPRCGKNVVEGKKSFFCESYYNRPSCGFALWKNDRFFTGKHKELTKKTVATLLKDGRIRMTGLFSEKKGVTYDATVVMEDTGDKFVHFKLEFDKKGK